MSTKMHYPGSTHKCAPIAEVTGVQLVDERDPARINVIYNGTRSGTYMTALSVDSAVELIIRLEAVVRKHAARTGFTSSEYVRLVEHRAKGSDR